jgi:putative lipoic acid-binding regulatory protein
MDENENNNSMKSNNFDKPIQKTPIENNKPTIESNKPINVSIQQNIDTDKNQKDKNNFYLRLILFLVMSYFIFFTKIITQPIFSLTKTLTENILINYISIDANSMILMINIITLFILGNLVYITFPAGIFERKIQLLKKQFIFLIVILVIIASYSNLTYNTTNPLEKVNKEINKSSDTFVENIKDILCYFDPQCVISKTNTKESEKTNREYKQISFQTPYLNDIEINYDSLIKKPLLLNYEFENLKDFKILKIDCYQDKISKENLFFSKELNLDSNDPKFFSKINKEIYCDFKNLKNDEELKLYSTTIYPVLEFEFIENNKIEIPITFQDLIYEKVKNEFPQVIKPIEYPNQFLYRYMKSTGTDVKIISEELINSKLLNIAFKIPLIYGNNIEDNVELDIELYENKYSSLGKIKNVEITKITTDEKYLKIINQETFKSTDSDSNSKKLFLIKLNLKENENQNFDNIYSEFLYTPVNINLIIKSELQNSFKININNDKE